MIFFICSCFELLVLIFVSFIQLSGRFDVFNVTKKINNYKIIVKFASDAEIPRRQKTDALMR